MDANLYVEIVERHIPEINQMLGDDWRFQQDNDPKHTSRIAKTFLNDNVPEVMDWPSNSPDLNPIENLWNIVKTNVEKRMPDNRGDLEQFMKEEWGKIPDSVLINLVNSMKTVVSLLLKKMVKEYHINLLLNKYRGFNVSNELFYIDFHLIVVPLH